MNQTGLSEQTPIKWIKTIDGISNNDEDDYNQKNINAFIGTYESINDCLACSNEAEKSRKDRYDFYVTIFNDLILTYNTIADENRTVEIDTNYVLKKYNSKYSINCPKLDENSKEKFYSFNISKNLTLNNNKYQKKCPKGCKK